MNYIGDNEYSQSSSGESVVFPVDADGGSGVAPTRHANTAIAIAASFIGALGTLQAVSYRQNLSGQSTIGVVGGADDVSLTLSSCRAELTESSDMAVSYGGVDFWGGRELLTERELAILDEPWAVDHPIRKYQLSGIVRLTCKK